MRRIARKILCIYDYTCNICMIIYDYNMYINYTYFILQPLANDIVQAGLEFLQLPLIRVWLSHVAHSTCPKQPTWDHSPAIWSAIHQSYLPSWNKGNEHKELVLQEPWRLPNPLGGCSFAMKCLWGELRRIAGEYTGGDWWCWSTSTARIWCLEARCVGSDLMSIW